MFISMHLILGWASFCMNYCIDAAWHGGNQPVTVLRCNGSPGFFDSGLQVICIVGSGVSHLPLDKILYGVQVSRVCWPIKHSNTMVIEPAFGTFGSVDRCQNLLENEISIFIKLVSRRKHEVLKNFLVDVCIDCGLQKTQWTKTSRWHGSPNHHWLWKLYTGPSSNMDSVPLLSSSRLWDLDFQIKCNIYFHLKRGLWITEQQSSSFSL